jgi:hypothetical protein
MWVDMQETNVDILISAPQKGTAFWWYSFIFSPHPHTPQQAGAVLPAALLSSCLLSPASSSMQLPGDTKCCCGVVYFKTRPSPCCNLPDQHQLLLWPEEVASDHGNVRACCIPHSNCDVFSATKAGHTCTMRPCPLILSSKCVLHWLPPKNSDSKRCVDYS